MKKPQRLPSIAWLVFLIVSVGPTTGQTNGPPPWGRVNPADLAMRYYPADPSAPALVLSDYLIVGFEVDEREGFQFRAQRHRRVKYFEQFAYTRDPVRIDWYEPLERISRLRVLLYFPNGKKRRLGKGAFRVESLDNGWKQLVLKLPDLPAGTILEYRYRLSSEYYDQLPVWYFQEQYPVRRSEYRSILPPWYDYATLAAPDTALLTTVSREEFSLIQAPYGYAFSRFDGSNYLQLVAEALPAIPQEPYSNNAAAYIPQLQKRLRAVVWPDTTIQLYPTWPQLADTLRQDPAFGLRYLAADQIENVRRILGPRLRQATSPAERARWAYRAIAEHLTWNGEYAIRSERSPDAIWAAGTAHSGEQNLLLLAVLRDLGITAYPVLVRTRDSGIPLETLALQEQFDHVLVLAQLGDQAYFFDVGNPYRPAGLPRIAALNNRGWLITDDDQSWIDLRVPLSEQVVRAELTLDSTGASQGTLRAELTGYYAAAAREQLQYADGQEEGPLIDVLRSYYPGTEALGRRTLSGADSLSSPLPIVLDCRIPIGRREIDKIYVTPMLFPSLDVGLATADWRQFPLDFSYPWSEQYTLSLNLPAGYTVEALPDPVELRSPDNGVRFSYQVRENDGQLTLEHRIAVLKTFYTAAEYEAAIRDILVRAIERQEDVLVLRRAAPAAD